MAEKTKAWEKFEMDLEAFLRKCGFVDVAQNPQGFRFADNRCQIDAIGAHDANVLLIECKAQEARGTSSEVKKWIQQLNGRREEFTRAISSHSKYGVYKNVFLVLALSKEFIVTEEQKKYARQLNVSIWDERYVSYYLSQPAVLKDVTLHNILADVGAKVPGDHVHTAVAFKTKISVGTKGFNAYSFSVNPKELTKYCYVARREHGESDYYQRIIDSSRLSKVAAYIDKGGSFVNNIIVAHDPAVADSRLSFSSIHKHLGKVANHELLSKLDSKEYNLEIGLLQFPLNYKSFWVIDGQHRLFGYLAANTARQESATVPVVMIEEIEPREQMRLFVDINHKQKTINANLIWDIKGDIEPETADGATSNLIKQLDEKGTLQGKVKIPSRRNRAPINLSSFCRAIIKSGLMKEHIKWIADPNPYFKNENYEATANLLLSALTDYFDTLAETLPEEKFEQAVLNSTGIEIFVALFSLLSATFRSAESAKTRREKIMRWVKEMSRHLDSGTISDIKRATGEALKDDATKKIFALVADSLKDSQLIEINKNLTKAIPGYEELERELRGWLASVFDRYSEDKRSLDQWFDAACPEKFDMTQYQLIKKRYAGRDEFRQKDARLIDFLTLGNLRFLLLSKDIQALIGSARAEVGTLAASDIINHLNFILPERNIEAHDTPTLPDAEVDAQVKASVSAILRTIEKYKAFFSEEYDGDDDDDGGEISL